MTVLYIVLGIWLAGFIAFVGAMFAEAPKHQARVGLPHIIVALGWPFWGLWYLWITFNDYRKRR